MRGAHGHPPGPPPPGMPPGPPPPGVPPVPPLPPGSNAKRVWLLVLALVAVLIVVGVVIWLAFPNGSSDSSAPGSSGSATASAESAAITGATVKQVLLDGDELAAMLDQPFAGTYEPPRDGGLAAMGGSSATDCLGVVAPAQKSVYESSNVQRFAQEIWGQGGRDDPTFVNMVKYRVTYVDESVIALPDEAAAQALFADFARQWRRCGGQTVTQTFADLPDGSAPPDPEQKKIDNIRVTESVLAATVTIPAVEAYGTGSSARAIGVRGNCLVDVEIAFNLRPGKIGTADPDTSGIDVVQAMIDKVAELS